MEFGDWSGEQAGPFAPSAVRGGILWNTAGQVAARALGFAIVLILARLVVPRDFGLIAIGNVFIAFVAVVTDIGVGSALVQRESNLRANASAAFYMNALMILVFGAGLLLLSGSIATFYRESSVRGLLAVLTVAFLVRGWSAVHEAYLRRRMLFRRLQLINLASILAYGVAAVALAWIGEGAWSIAWGTLLEGCVYAGLVVAASGMPLSPSLHLHRWGDLFSYGRWVFLGGVATWALQSGDNLAVGKFLGAGDLGAYSIAYAYGLLPASLIGAAVAQALFPAYARLQGDLVQLRDLIVKIVRVSAVVCLPIAGVFLFAGRDVLIAALGPRWAPAGRPFQVFAVMFTALLFTASFPRVYDAVNRPIVNLYVALAALPVMVAGTVIGLHFGVLGVALGISVMLVEMGVVQIVAVSRTTGLSAGVILAAVWPAAACAILGVAAGAAPLLLLRQDLAPLAADAIACAVLLAVYILAVRRLFPALSAEAWAQVRAVLATLRAG